VAHRKKSVATFIGVTAITAGLFIAPAMARDAMAASTDVENFVLETGRKVISVQQEGGNHRIVLKKIFRARFDYKLMGRFALGRFWKKAAPKQITEYNELFAAYVPNGYVGRLSEYQGAEFALVKSRNLSGSDSVVTTRLAPKKGDVIVFDWRVREKNSQYKVIDLMVGSVSYLKTLRQEFTSVAARNGIEGLLDLLREHATANTTGADQRKQSIAESRRASNAIVAATKISLQAKLAVLVAGFRRIAPIASVAMR